MRLWHQALIQYLDDKRLLGQHRECCALRGKGWGKKHATVDYVFKHRRIDLYKYHVIVMTEMCRRGFSPDVKWLMAVYRGKNMPCDTWHDYTLENPDVTEFPQSFVKFLRKKHDFMPRTVYAEHDIFYLKECLQNLQSKGARLKCTETVEEILMHLDLEQAFE